MLRTKGRIENFILLEFAIIYCTCIDKAETGERDFAHNSFELEHCMINTFLESSLYSN